VEQGVEEKEANLIGDYVVKIFFVGSAKRVGRERKRFSTVRDVYVCDPRLII
jgi:hypothetical protein